MSWRILQRWFNVAPWKDAEYIIDNRGEKFWISWHDLKQDVAKVRLRYRSWPVGHINMNEEDGPVLVLADIHVEKPYRGRGLGKQMLNKVIQWAKQDGYQEICGTIKPSEGVTREYLQEWYMRQGFNVNGTKLSMILDGNYRNE
jgi:GNAT superfamily N-acetyltransferase